MNQVEKGACSVVDLWGTQERRGPGMPERPHAGRYMGTNRLGALIAVGNQKGGVGKTTNTVHLSSALGEKGYEVLIIDLNGSPPKGK